MVEEVSPRLPWEIVETLPSTDSGLIQEWTGRLAAARSISEEVGASVGLALTLYWAHQEGLESDFRANLRRREDLIGRASELARDSGDADSAATAILGELYALWGPDPTDRVDILVAQLDTLAPDLEDPELRVRSAEWRVLRLFQTGEVERAREAVSGVSAGPDARALPMFARREELWRANLAMIDGHLDEAVRINTDAISATADAAGSPFSFQNVAVTIAIERYLRRGLEDVLESLRSIRASSPRVGANWDAGLAFSLAETGHLEESAALFDALAEDEFEAVPRDLNWLVTMHLLGLVAIGLEDAPRIRLLREILGPFGHLDATHGAGYASYGPVGRVVGGLAAATGDLAAARPVFDQVIAGAPPGPWQSLARLDRARAFASVDPLASFEDASAATAEFRSYDMGGWIKVAGDLRAELVAHGSRNPTVVRRGNGFALHHDLGSAVVTGKGGQYLVRLLRSPGEAFGAVELEGSGTPGGGVAPGTGHSEPALDATAIRAYRKRLAELVEPGRVLEVQEAAEVEFLQRALAGGSYVVSNSAEEERARVRVTKALRRCMRAVSDSSPSLAEHLFQSISTGASCMYAPADGRRWEIVTGS